MPIVPQFSWEQTLDEVRIDVLVKGIKREAIDVFIADVLVKVNAAPTYLASFDLLREIDVERSGYVVDTDHHRVRLVLRKRCGGDVWPSLCVDRTALSREERRERREGSISRAEALYNVKLDTREKMKSVEQRRLLKEFWEVEADQRAAIIAKVREEHEREGRGVEEWSQSLEGVASPADIAVPASKPTVRRDTTTTVPISFTPKTLAVPTRSRGDDEYYRKSRYKPVSVTDSPMYWKHRADSLYRSGAFEEAADAYSESIKRDGSFLSCIGNRAACRIRLHQYARAIEDCSLALTILANTPASETTQQRYRTLMTMIHTRRGAAKCWNGDLEGGLEDYRLAAAYSEGGNDGVVDDVLTLERLVGHHHGDKREPSLMQQLQSTATRQYYGGQYAEALATFEQMLVVDEFDVRIRSNITACYLHLSRFNDALRETERIVELCAEAASALAAATETSDAAADSDDEEGGDDEYVTRRKAAAKRLGEKSGHVYVLLKAYVRAAAAHCGLKQYHKAMSFFEAALRITPYDDDLRADAERVMERVRMDALVSASRRE